MLAATVDRYGPPETITIRTLPTPTPGKNQVRVRVLAAAVTAADARIRGATFPPGFGIPARLVFGIRRPRRAVLGGSCSGVVDAVGPGVLDMAVGDEVCALAGMAMGAHAEFLVVNRSKVVPKPVSVPHEVAAGAIFGGLTSRHFIEDRAKVAAGSRVLINGASGALGTAAVQLATARGAEVTAVTSAPNAALVTQLGADQVVDYAATPVAELTERFDTVYDTVGNLSTAVGKRLLKPQGTLILAAATLGQTIAARGRVVAGPAPDKASDLAIVLGYVESGALQAPIDSVVAFENMTDAHRRVDSGRKVGNIVLCPQVTV